MREIMSANIPMVNQDDNLVQVVERFAQAALMNGPARAERHAILASLVDEIGDVLETEAEQYETPPETLPAAARELITGVYKLPERLLLVLDTEKTLALEAAAR